jgi:hypothetical protein
MTSSSTIDPPAATVRDMMLRYVQEGIPVFPLANGSKVPPAGSHGHLEAILDKPVILGWTESNPSLNWGAAAGAERVNPTTGEVEHLEFVDLDKKKGKDGAKFLQTLCEKKGIEIPDTLTVETPTGGLHLPYWFPGPRRKHVADVLGPSSGVDLPNYVVGPESTIDGRPYRIVSDVPIASCGRVFADLFPIDDSAPKPADTTPPLGIDASQAHERAAVLLNATLGAPQGSRGSTAYKLAAHVRELGCDELATFELMDEIWATKCTPPMPSKDLAESVNHAFRYAKEPQGNAAPEAIFDPVPAEQDPLAGAESWTIDQVRENADILAMLWRSNRKKLADLASGWEMLDIIPKTEVSQIVLNAELTRVGLDPEYLAEHRSTLERAETQRALASLNRENPEAYQLLVEMLVARKVGKMAIKQATNKGQSILREGDVDGDRRRDGRIVVAHQPANLVRTLDEVEAAILAPDGPEPVFSFAGAYVTVRQGKPVTVRQLNGGDYPPMAVIARYDEPGMRERITRSIRLEGRDRNGAPKPIPVPADLVKMLLSRRGGTAPPLTGIVEAPTLRPNGSVLAREGYDAATGLLATFNGHSFPAIPPHPSRQDARAALRFIEDEVFAEFPFAEPVDQTVAAAALVTGLVRSAVGIAPAFLFSAPSQSTGKTALAHLIVQGAFGRPAAASAWPHDDNEMAKFLLAALREGQRAVVFDNIPDGHTINSSQLAAAITSESYTARILSVSDTATVPTSALWLLTGNNVRLAGDMPSRVLRAYLDSKEERPDQRSYSRDLIPWASEHRARIVEAALTVVRAYVAAGCPKQADTATRFPTWDKLVRNPLIFAGGLDVAEKFSTAFQEDPVLSAWAEVLEAWFDLFGRQPMSVAVVVNCLQTCTFGAGDADKAMRLNEALKCALDDPKGLRFTAKGLGKRLAIYENRPLAGLRLRKTLDSHDKVNRWIVEPAG